MSDPFGALAMQRKGDFGYFDGTQWRSSFASNSAPLTGSGVSSGTVMLVEGSAGSPVKTQGVTLFVSRDAKVDGAGDNNAAISGNNRNNGSNQPVAVQGYAQNTGSGDACAFYGRSTTTTGRAYGYFVVAGFTGTGGGGTFPGALGLNPFMVNGSGVNATWDGGGNTPFMAGLFIQQAQSTKWNGAGIHVSDNSNLDVGIGFKPGSVVNQTFRDDSSSTTSIQITGTHTYAVDVSGATSITTGWHGALTVDNEVTITRAIGSAYFERFVTTGGGSKNYGITVANIGASNDSWGIDEVGVAQKFYITPGTPGANTTCLVIQEGATPTSRRLKTFDPGAAGVNFTAGQLVCVLV